MNKKHFDVFNRIILRIKREMAQSQMLLFLLLLKMKLPSSLPLDLEWHPKAEKNMSGLFTGSSHTSHREVSVKPQ